MWQYEYTDDICPLQNIKKIKENVQTLTDSLKIFTKKRLQTFLNSLNDHQKKKKKNTHGHQSIHNA